MIRQICIFKPEEGATVKTATAKIEIEELDLIWESEHSSGTVRTAYDIETDEKGAPHPTGKAEDD